MLKLPKTKKGSVNIMKELVEELVKHINEKYPDNLNKFIIQETTKYYKVNMESKDKRLDHRSSYAFIPKDDVITKSLSAAKGSILMAATWSKPAKHARGSIFNKETWTCCGQYGVAYLR